ncbi:MAG: glycosyltransferase family 39 protein [Chloroflexota bacterium]
MTNQSEHQNLPTEPSVLDYFKALLRPWNGDIPQIPELSESEIKSTVLKQPDAIDQPQPGFQGGLIPWRTLIALFIALVAQLALVSKASSGLPGAILMAVAIGLAIWAVGKGELALVEPSLEEEPKEQDDHSVILWPLVSGLLILIGAFLAFGGNKFTDLNLLLWYSGIALVLWALWYPQPDFSYFWKKILMLLKKDRWQLTFSWPVVLFVLILGISIFFRVNQIGLVVPEMVSDQAEKLLDVVDVFDGQRKIFFQRNTGREGLQMYLIAFTSRLFNTGISFLSMKIGTIFFGIVMLPFIYLIGKELGNKTVGLFAMFFSGIAFWLNSLARVALRFILYPAFAAPTIYFLLRGLRTGRRRDFILTGLFLGIGLHGYTPFRAVPILVVVALALYWLHHRGSQRSTRLLVWLGIIVLVSFVIFLPLLRVWIEMPGMFNSRTISRLTNLEVGETMPQGSALIGVFLRNVWDGLLMLNWDSGPVWVNTIPGMPNLDVVSGALFVLGFGLLLWRYLTKRKWQDAFLLLAIPILMLPSTLALAYPNENPSTNRAGGAAVIVFVIIALALEAIYRTVNEQIPGKTGERFALFLAAGLAIISLRGNYTMTFETYKNQYIGSAWNTSELGAVIEQFVETVGNPDQAWVVAYPHWVDTRLVGINAGQPTRDYAIWPEEIEYTLAIESPKLFLFKINDEQAIAVLEELYPEGKSSLYTSDVPSRSFFIYYVP